MQINLSSADQNYIREAVRNGFFPSEEEAVVAAVTRMRQEAEAGLRRLRDAIEQGRDDVATGRVEDYTPDLLNRIFEEAGAAVERGEKFTTDPHVFP